MIVVTNLKKLENLTESELSGNRWEESLYNSVLTSCRQEAGNVGQTDC